MLQAQDFRHPLDETNTQLLQLVPALPGLTKALLGARSARVIANPVSRTPLATAPVAEEALYLQHIGASVLVGPTQLPWLHRLTLEAAATLGLAPPALYVRQGATPNAYTLAVNGRRPAVVVHTALIDLLTETELQAAIGHELGHLKCEHGVWLTLAAALAAPAGSLPGVPSFVAEGAAEALARWARAAELSCDRAAALVAREPRVVVSLLMKLAGGSPKLAAQLNADAFLAQADGYDAAAGGGAMGALLAMDQLRSASHPLPVARAAEVSRWARSPQFVQLLRSLPLHSPWPRAAAETTPAMRS